MNRKAGKIRTFNRRESAPHFKGPAAMKPGLFCRHWRRLRAALVLPAAALLLYSCDPPASPSSAVREVTRISGLPNMAQIERRLNDQYDESAKDTEDVEFKLSRTSGTTVSASITYAEGKLLPMEIGGTKHDIKTITITREVDGKTIPTRVEYEDNLGKIQKTITSRYVQRPNAAANNARQSLEGSPQLAEAETEGRTLHISGEEKDGADNILRTFTATERTGGGTTTLKTTYRRPDKEGFTEILTTENGIPTRKELTYPDKDAAAKTIKTEIITYENPKVAMFYPEKEEIKDESTITTTFRKDGSRLAVHKNKDGTETKSVETRSDKSTITTKTTAGGITLAVYKKPDGITETKRIETQKDGSTITTEPTPEGMTKALVIHSSVTAIEDGAFSGGKLTSLTIGNSVKTIGNAFADNPQLKTVRITGKGVIKNNAFTYEDSSRITKGIFSESGSSEIELIIEDGITEIGNYAFYKNQLTSVTIPPSVTKIGAGAFSDNKLTTLIIGNNLQTMGKQAFKNNKLTSVNIGNGVKTIEMRTFQNNHLKSLIIGNSVETIGKQAFENNKLTKLKIIPSVAAIEHGAFANNMLKWLTIENGVETIGKQAFENNKLITLWIPPSVTAIEDAAFSRNKLTLVILPKALYDARGGAFNDNPVGLRFRDHARSKLGTN